MIKKNVGVVTGLDFTSVIGPDALREMLAQGRPVLVLARNSNASKGGVAEATSELKKTAGELKNKVGIDISLFLPSDISIASAFAQAPTVRTDAETTGKKLTHKFVCFTPTPGLVILMGVGTGRGLSSMGDQPWVKRVVEQVKKSQPALLYVHRIDRLSRHMFSTSEVLNICRFKRTMVGDPQNGINLPDNFNSLINLFLSSSGENEADKIPTSTRKGMKAKTETQMVDGRKSKYACIASPPAGILRLRVKNTLGAQGDSVILLDDPIYYPDADTIFAYLPKTIAEKTISNVELVKWVLANYGKPGYTKASMGKYLIANYFSHTSYRRQKGVEATFHDFKRPGYLITALLRNLSFYETGTFVSKLGVKGIEDVEISGCMPEGGWATPKDFARIKRVMAQTPKRHAGVATMAFTGVSVGDQGLYLRRAPEHRSKAGPSYGLVAYKSGETPPKRQQMEAITHAALAGSLVEAIELYAQRTWDPIAQEDENSTALQELEKALQEESELVCEINKRREELTQRDENGNLPSVLVLNILGGELERLENQTRPMLNNKIARLRAGISVKPNGDDVKGLLKLVASLHNPYDASQNTFWKDCLHIEKVTRSSNSSNSNRLLNIVIKWNGTLTLSEGQNEFAIPFAGSMKMGALQANRQRVDEVIEKVINGDGPMDKIPMANPLAMRTLIAEAFGYRGKFGGICGCPDAELQAILFTMLAYPELGDTEVAHQHRVQQQLIANLRTYTKSPPARWQTTRKETLTGLSQAIASGNANDYYIQIKHKGSIEKFSQSEAVRGTLTVSDGQLAINPCECGSVLRLLSKIKGPQGFVCYDCGTDNAGAKWASKYRQYLIGAQHFGIKEYTILGRKSPGTSSRKRYPPKNQIA